MWLELAVFYDVSATEEGAKAAELCAAADGFGRGGARFLRTFDSSLTYICMYRAKVAKVSVRKG